ncbi:hypothetical protein Acaty_2p0002 (plasmid) [Acidithiobacillus caldus ATCC 51756]|uniref:Transcriptional regulator n=1 Tax=Acidithiobacillus caldus (strain ATCC 51756 / DSM 8584 / KU) TaxID=637389 RepID=A0A060A3S0_ACICK|nr:hypothetical protein Acaty_2p0002 [Acidithiobacillus caldus ATCC 51756]
MTGIHDYRKTSPGLLAALEDGPKTGAELSAALHLKATRIRSLLLHLPETQGKVHAPHSVTRERGRPVNLWELRPGVFSETGTP